jgi:ectoine hydroxylase-related dioxygenase (phytanoyl-CoA dioxygenase family)
LWFIGTIATILYFIIAPRAVRLGTFSVAVATLVRSGYMTTLEALDQLGVQPDLLSDEERKKLDDDGFLVIEGAMTREQVNDMRHTLAALIQKEGREAGKEVHQEEGTHRLADLVNKGSEFEVCFTHPKVLAAISHVLRHDLKLSSLNARAALPNEGNQPLHADWGPLEREGVYQVCNSIWMLDDFTEENGATRVVPGSHLKPKVKPEDEMEDPEQPHPAEQLILGPAGSVAVFNAHVWHGGTQNKTDKPRRAVHSYWTRRENEQQLNQLKHIRLATQSRLSPAQRYLLDVG